MKKKFKWMSAMLTMCILAITMTVVSCSDDDEKTNVWYALGFTEINTSSPDALREMGEIEAAYKKALGITESPFSKFGTVEECNQQVLNACQQAENALKEKAGKVLMYSRLQMPTPNKLFIKKNSKQMTTMPCCNLPR